MKKVNKDDLVFALGIGIPIVVMASFYIMLFMKDIKTGFAAVGVTTVGLIISLIVGLIIFELFDLYFIS